MTGHNSGFYEWLITQTDRDDPIGDLASDMKRDQDVPTTEDDREIWALHLQKRNESYEALAALSAGWEEYQSITKSA